MENFISTSTPHSPSTELIKLMSSGSTKVVPARELYSFLEITERFNSWFQRMVGYGFVENQDFTSVNSFTLVNNGAQRQIDDYALTFDCAKHIAMVQRSEKGMQARQYFIDQEKVLRQIKEPSRLEILQMALQSEQQRIQLEKEKKELEVKNDKLLSDNTLKSIQIQRDSDKVEFANQVSSAKNTYLFREAIKAVNSDIKENDLRKLMLRDKILYIKNVMGQNEYHSYASHKDKFFEKTNPLPNGINKTTLKFKASSLSWLNNYIKKNIHRI